MKKALLLMILLVSFLRMNGNPDSCRETMRTDIERNWKFSYGFYLTTLYFTTRIDLDYAPCILLMQKQELIDLLGEPTIREGSSIWYKVIAVDNNGGIAKGKTRYIIFFIDQNDSVQGYQGYYK